jgi:hypothetical protein
MDEATLQTENTHLRQLISRAGCSAEEMAHLIDEAKERLAAASNKIDELINERERWQKRANFAYDALDTLDSAEANKALLILDSQWQPGWKP